MYQLRWIARRFALPLDHLRVLGELSNLEFRLHDELMLVPANITERGIGLGRVEHFSVEYDYDEKFLTSTNSNNSHRNDVIFSTTTRDLRDQVRPREVRDCRIRGILACN